MTTEPICEYKEECLYYTLRNDKYNCDKRDRSKCMAYQYHKHLEQERNKQKGNLERKI
jgi:hypothetical protein